jgi:hypothetical protein
MKFLSLLLLLLRLLQARMTSRADLTDHRWTEGRTVVSELPNTKQKLFDSAHFFLARAQGCCLSSNRVTISLIQFWTINFANSAVCLSPNRVQFCFVEWAYHRKTALTAGVRLPEARMYHIFPASFCFSQFPAASSPIFRETTSCTWRSSGPRANPIDSAAAPGSV